MIRQARKEDIDRIAEIYEHMHDQEEKTQEVTGWVRSIYPTYNTAKEAVDIGEMYVEVIDDHIVASGRINQIQVEQYKQCDWLYKASDDNVMVLHTLIVDPSIKGKGYGSEFIKFYEDYALEHNCHYLRIDTNENNLPARRFYHHHGFREAGIFPCDFNGITDVHLVCLEKKI